MLSVSIIIQSVYGSALFLPLNRNPVRQFSEWWKITHFLPSFLSTPFHPFLLSFFSCLKRKSESEIERERESVVMLLRWALFGEEIEEEVHASERGLRIAICQLAG